MVSPGWSVLNKFSTHIRQNGKRKGTVLVDGQASQFQGEKGASAGQKNQCLSQGPLVCPEGEAPQKEEAQEEPGEGSTYKNFLSIAMILWIKGTLTEVRGTQYLSQSSRRVHWKFSGIDFLILGQHRFCSVSCPVSSFKRERGTFLSSLTVPTKNYLWGRGIEY